MMEEAVFLDDSRMRLSNTYKPRAWRCLEEVPSECDRQRGGLLLQVILLETKEDHKASTIRRADQGDKLVP